MTRPDTNPAIPHAIPQALPKLTLGFFAVAILYHLPEILLIGSQLWLTIWAAVWAVDGLFKLSGALALVPWALLGLPGLWASHQLIRLAIVGWQEKQGQST